MSVRILGCSGGIGKSLHTTSFLIDDTILIDAGTGLTTLSLKEMQSIEHIFLTHSHLDHIACLPLLLDSIFGYISRPVLLHGLHETLRAVKKHIFNYIIWPDFNKLPSPENPIVQFIEHRCGDRIRIEDLTIELLPVYHQIPATGYLLARGQTILVFSGDTSTNTFLWDKLNTLSHIDYLIVETAFPDRNMDVAISASHYSPTLLANDIRKLRKPKISELFISHLKPGFEDEIMYECKKKVKNFNPQKLLHNQIFSI